MKDKLILPCGAELHLEDVGEISDGYHTFNELYDHRITLYIALCKAIHLSCENNGFNNIVWRSKKHSDGSMMDGWFIMGIGKKAGEQVTYHLPLDRWKETDFAETLDKAPEYDGHTPADTLERLKKL